MKRIMGFYLDFFFYSFIVRIFCQLCVMLMLYKGPKVALLTRIVFIILFFFLVRKVFLCKKKFSAYCVKFDVINIEHHWKGEYTS